MINQFIHLIYLFILSLNSRAIFVSESFTRYRLEVEHLSQTYIGFEHSQLLFSLVFGSDDSFSYHQRHVFKVIGMLHVLSASGFNLRIIHNLIEKLLHGIGCLSQKIKTILVGLSGSFFFLSSNTGYSMQRAMITSTISLTVKGLFRRQLSSLRILIYVFLGWLLLNPEVINSISWRMSMAAVTGIIWLLPLFNSLFDVRLIRRNRHRKPWLIKMCLTVYLYFVQSVSLYLAAQVGVMPILTAVWGEVNFFGLVSASLLSPMIIILFYLALAWFGICSFNLLLSNILFKLFNLSVVFSFFITSITSLFLNAANFLADFGHNYIWKLPELNPLIFWVWYLTWFTIGWLWRWHRNKLEAAALSLVNS